MRPLRQPLLASLTRSPMSSPCETVFSRLLPLLLLICLQPLHGIRGAMLVSAARCVVGHVRLLRSFLPDTRCPRHNPRHDVPYFSLGHLRMPSQSPSALSALSSH